MDTPETDPSIERLYQLLDQLADTGDIDQSVEAISLLEAEAVPAWLPLLHEALEVPDDSYFREGVAPAIIRLEGMAALPSLITALRLGFAEGHDCDSLQTHITDLVESDPAAAIALLLPMTDSPDPADRADAAWLLDFVHEEVPPDIFLRLAADNAPEVRRKACGALGSLKAHEPSFQMLIRRLDDDDEEVRISAMSSLGYFGDPRALPLLESLQVGSNAHAHPILVHAISTLNKS